jgi:hypothetical protein
LAVLASLACQTLLHHAGVATEIKRTEMITNPFVQKTCPDLQV